MMLGRVDEVDGHFVATRFVAGAIPIECLYITYNPRSTGGGPGAVRIRIDWRSVGLAYARVWLPFLAVALIVGQVARGHLALVVCIVSAALLGFSIAAHRWGRLPENEKARLRVLGTVTGLRIEPAKLHESTREIKRASLGELMEKGGIPMTPDGIVGVLDEIPLPAMPLVYGYARYAGDDPAWQECAALVYARYEQGEF